MNNTKQKILPHCDRIFAFGVEWGIWTLGTWKGTQHFQCCSFGHSDNSTCGQIENFFSVAQLLYTIIGKKSSLFSNLFLWIARGRYSAYFCGKFACISVPMRADSDKSVTILTFYLQNSHTLFLNTPKFSYDICSVCKCNSQNTLNHRFISVQNKQKIALFE